MKYYLYNPLSKNKNRPEFLDKLDPTTCEVIETDVFNHKEFVSSLKEDDEIVLVGGDGTVNYFVNAIDGILLKNNVYLRTNGHANDFINDIEKYDDEVLLNPYINNLPKVEVKELDKYFINGIGFGLDGYCCLMEDKLKKENKKVDYKKIGKRGILKTKPFNTTIIVDGKTYVHSNVWFASCMKGRYNGSGMMLSPLQDRTTGDVSLIVFTQKSKLKALKLFSKIFKKNHLENTESFIVYTGKTIEVTSNIPLTLHIDGEKVTDVTTYKVKISN